MASVRKKYNREKHAIMQATHRIKDNLICYTDTMKVCQLYNRKKKRLEPADELFALAMTLPWKWSCFIAAFGNTGLDEYFKCEQIFAPSRFHQKHLAPIFEEHHRDLIKRIPSHQLAGVGWIADPHGSDISESEAGEIFIKLKAWG